MRPRKEETLKKVTIRLDDHTRKKLESESQKSQTTLSETIRKKLR
jgi:hypothetical protein